MSPLRGINFCDASIVLASIEADYFDRCLFIIVQCLQGLLYCSPQVLTPECSLELLNLNGATQEKSNSSNAAGYTLT